MNTYAYPTGVLALLQGPNSTFIHVENYKTETEEKKKISEWQLKGFNSSGCFSSSLTANVNMNSKHLADFTV